MTIASKLKDIKDIEAEKPAPTESKENPPSRPSIACIVMFRASQRRRRNLRRNTSVVRDYSCFILLIGALIFIDVVALMSTDSNTPGPFVRLTGLYPTFNLLMLITLHMMTLFGGLSKTVRGCRLAMGIAWMIFFISVILLLFVPSFVGSFLGSGINPKNYSAVPTTSANERFETAFYSAVGSQMIVFIIFLASVYQLTVVGQLLAEAHLIEDTLRLAQQVSTGRGDSGAGAGEAFLPTV